MASTNIVNGLLYQSRPGKRTLYKGFGNLKIPALTASAKQKLYRENQLKKPTPGNNLTLFNNWIDVQQKPSLKNLQEQLVTGSGDPQSRTLRPLLQFVPKFQLYTSNGKWGGKLIQDAKQIQQNRIDSHYTSSVQSNNLIKKNAQVDQVQKEIPVIIQQIIQTSANLGVAGFGPVKKNGSGLYAGRWVSQKTGKIRVLPNASTKNLNPASYRQKLAYHQARLINLWNKLQRQQQIYQDFADKDEVQFDQKFSKRLQRGLTQIGAMTSLKQMTSFIVKLQKNFIKTLTNTNNDKLNNQINGLILNADPGLVKDLFGINLYSMENYIDFIPDWDRQVRAVFQGFAQQGENQKQQIKRAKAAQKLIYSSFSRVLPYVIQSLKTMVLPTNNSANLSQLKKNRQKLDSQIKTLRNNAVFNLQPISDYRVALSQLANGVNTMMTNIINQMFLQSGGNSNMNLLQLDQGMKKGLQQPQTTAFTQQNMYGNPGNPNNIAYQPVQQYIPMQNQQNPYFPNGYFQSLNNIYNQNNGVIKQQYEGQGRIPRVYNSLNQAQQRLSRSQVGNNSSSKMIDQKSKSILRKSLGVLTLVDTQAKSGLNYVGWTILSEYYSLIMNAKQITQLSMNFMRRRNNSAIQYLKGLGSLFPINFKQINNQQRPDAMRKIFVPYMSGVTKNGTPFNIKLVYQFVSAYIIYLFPNAVQPLFKLTTAQVTQINQTMYLSIESWGIILAVIRSANAQIQLQQGQSIQDVASLLMTGMLDKPIYRFQPDQQYTTAVQSIFGQFVFNAIADQTYKDKITAQLLKTSSQIDRERQQSYNMLSNNLNSSQRQSSGPNTYVADTFLNKQSPNVMRQQVNLASLLGARFPSNQPLAQQYYKLYKAGKKSGISKSTLKYLQQNLK